MYPWFHFHHPGYPPSPPPPPTGSAFADAGANAAGASARQHHVYLHGTEGFGRYGRGRFYRRGPSRLKWFILGALAATVYFNHRRHQQLRYGDEEHSDPRNYFFACRRRREDLPYSSSSASGEKRSSLASTSDSISAAEKSQEWEWRNRWHNQWRMHEEAQRTASTDNASAPEPSTEMKRSSSADTMKTKGSSGTNNTETNGKVTAEPDGLLTYDNGLHTREIASKESTQRERMEAEAIAFAEEKIDALVGMLGGLKSKLRQAGGKGE